MEEDYGKAGARDRRVIDQYLKRVPKHGVVLNLGCGPNLQPLRNLARSMARFQFHSTLILADLATDLIQDALFTPAPTSLRIVTLNAATASQVLGTSSVNLILALGFFGALSIATMEHHADAQPRVLSECAKLLKVDACLIVSNSCDRQPEQAFQILVQNAGFVVTYHHTSQATLGAERADEQRYLLVCRKPLRPRPS